MTQATDRVREKFEALLDRGRNQAADVMTRLEIERPQDHLVNTKAFRFRPDEDRGVVVDVGDAGTFKVHRHAMQQAVGRTKVLGMRTVNKLYDQVGDNGRPAPWAMDLLSHNMNTVYDNIDRDRVLIRAVNNEVRGVLSDRYRRMDSGPIFERFVRGAQEFGGVPTDARFLDTKVTMTMHQDRIYEPIANDPFGMMIVGASLSNSDFGDGALSLKFSMMRIWCINLCMRDDAFRKVHIGGRLADDFTFSERTYKLDTEAQASAVSDLLAAHFDPDRINAELEQAKAAAGTDIDATKLFQQLQRRGTLTKTESKRAQELFNSADVELLPPGNNVWRASNVLSLFAQEEDVDARRGLALQEIAGGLLDTHVQVAA
jgi:hypothetical protein